MARKKTTEVNEIGKSISKRFLTGLLVIVPIGAVVLVLIWFFESIDNIFQPIIEGIFGTRITGLGFAITIVLIYFTGLFASNIVGKRLINWGESFMMNVPVLKSLYSGTKQVVASVSGAGLDKAAFREVVLVEFPREGMQTIAFVTNDVMGTDGKKRLMIYIPTAPMPTSGYFEIVTEDKVIRTDITVDEAMQMVISSGMVSPKVIDTCGKLKKGSSSKSGK